MKKLRATLNSKTALFAYAVIAAGLLEQVSPFIAETVPPEYRGLALSLLGLIVWFLRWVTKTPLGEK